MLLGLMSDDKRTRLSRQSRQKFMRNGDFKDARNKLSQGRLLGP